MFSFLLSHSLLLCCLFDAVNSLFCGIKKKIDNVSLVVHVQQLVGHSGGSIVGG